MRNDECGILLRRTILRSSFFVHRASFPLAQAGFEPAACLVLSETGLPNCLPSRERRHLAPRDESLRVPLAEREVYDAQRGSRTHSRAGLSRAALPLAYLGEAEAVGLEPTSGCTPPPVFKTGSSSSRMTSTFRSSGGWNRTNDLLGQSQASLPTATAPDHFCSRHFTSHKSSGRRIRTFFTWFKARQPTR